MKWIFDGIQKASNGIYAKKYINLKNSINIQQEIVRYENVLLYLILALLAVLFHAYYINRLKSIQYRLS
jgi:hypothetical protein